MPDMKAECCVPVSELMATVTLRVTGMPMLGFRVWLGKKLLSLAARVIGCGIKIETE
jgi:hypothetical protein